MVIGTFLGLIIVAVNSRATAESPRQLPHSAAQSQLHTGSRFPETHNGPHLVPLTDGAINPDAIPDDDAQLSFLKTALPKAGNLAQKAARAYLRNKLNIIDHPDTAESNRVLVEGLISITKDYSGRLDQARQEFLQRQPPQTAVFNAQKKQLLADFHHAMAAQMGPDGEVRMRNALTDVKKKTKIF